MTSESISTCARLPHNSKGRVADYFHQGHARGVLEDEHAVAASLVYLALLFPPLAVPVEHNLDLVVRLLHPLDGSIEAHLGVKLHVLTDAVLELAVAGHEILRDTLRHSLKVAGNVCLLHLA